MSLVAEITQCGSVMLLYCLVLMIVLHWLLV